MASCKPSRLVEELTCSICYELFANDSSHIPIMIPCCKQAYCQSCVDQIKICPNCRKEVCREELVPYRILLNILDCLCTACHRCEKDKNCMDCNLSLCNNCVRDHLMTHGREIEAKRAELKNIISTAQTLVTSIAESLTDYRSTLEKKLLMLDEISIPGDKEEDVEKTNSIEDAYLKELDGLRRIRMEASNHVIPRLINMAQELNVSVPNALTDFEQKPIFDKVEQINNVDLAMPADAVSFINAVCTDQVLSQIIGQQSVDRRQLVNKSALEFQLSGDEIATCYAVFRDSVILATNKARVLILKERSSVTEMPCISTDDHHPISGLVVTTQSDGKELILAVDGSKHIYGHMLNNIEDEWNIFFSGDDDMEFSDLYARGDSIFISSNNHVHLFSCSEKTELVTFLLNDEEQCPRQIIAVDDRRVLLRMEHQRHIFLKVLGDDSAAKKIEFNFYIHHIQFNHERRILSLIAHHDASDQYALHTFSV